MSNVPTAKMDLQSRVEQILNDERLDADDADVAKDDLLVEYGADTKPEAIYLLADQFEWPAVYNCLVGILQDDARAADWETAQIVLFWAAGDHKYKRRQCPIPADLTIALLYHRFPEGVDDGDRIWSIVCDLKGVKHWSHYDPLKDGDILRELKRLGSS